MQLRYPLQIQTDRPSYTAGDLVEGTVFIVANGANNTAAARPHESGPRTCYHQQTQICLARAAWAAVCRADGCMGMTEPIQCNGVQVKATGKGECTKQLN